MTVVLVLLIVIVIAGPSVALSIGLSRSIRPRRAIADEHRLRTSGLGPSCRPMNKVNLRDIPEQTWRSPKGAFAGASREISVALGREPASTDFNRRHPFDVEICRIPPGKRPYPYHSHSAQWEFYHVISGSGRARDAGGETPIAAGDAFLFQPGEAHQLLNDGPDDLVVYVVADNPIGETCHYPDSNKWLIRSPQRAVIRSAPLDYYDGEE